LISDGEDLSTPDLIRRLGKALGVTVRLWPFPPSVLLWMGPVARKQEFIDRLLGSLQVNLSKIKRELDWHPPFSVDRGLAETAAWYCASSLRLNAAS
jgi:nucleoside-diphosphate-sugar epimerase